MREQPFLEPNKRAALRFRRKKRGVRTWLVWPLLKLDWRGGFGK